MTIVAQAQKAAREFRIHDLQKIVNAANYHELVDERGSFLLGYLVNYILEEKLSPAQFSEIVDLVKCGAKQEELCFLVEVFPLFQESLAVIQSVFAQALTVTQLMEYDPQSSAAIDPSELIGEIMTKSVSI